MELAGNTIINYDHMQAHKGNLHTVSLKQADGTQYADNGDLGMLVDMTGQDEPLHTIWEVASGADAEFTAIEGVTWAASAEAGGGTLTPVNHNRVKGDKTITTEFFGYSSNLANTYATAEAEVTLFTYWLPGGVGRSAVGGMARGENEWILKPDTKYVFKLVNRGGAVKDGSIQCTFYED